MLVTRAKLGPPTYQPLPRSPTLPDSAGRM